MIFVLFVWRLGGLNSEVGLLEVGKRDPRRVDQRERVLGECDDVLDTLGAEQLIDCPAKVLAPASGGHVKLHQLHLGRGRGGSNGRGGGRRGRGT